MGNYKEYEDILSKTYDEAVAFLLQKYGSAQYDYFSENSYQRFMNGEIKTITRGKYKRTREGLYCHHIGEKENLNISNQLFVKENKIPFEFQKKDRLVYCNLIEHTILHVLITHETSQEFGSPGYEAWLKPMIEVWYLEDIMPRPEWMKICYHKSFLNPEETVNILRRMQEKIGDSYYNTPFDYHDAKRKRKEEFEERIKAREIEELEMVERNRESYEQYQTEMIEAYYHTYPAFKSIGIHSDSPRLKVIAKLYEYKYRDTYKSKKELNLAMKPIVKDKLLDELYLIISNVRVMKAKENKRQKMREIYSRVFFMWRGRKKVVSTVVKIHSINHKWFYLIYFISRYACIFRNILNASIFSEKFNDFFINNFILTSSIYTVFCWSPFEFPFSFVRLMRSLSSSFLYLRVSRIGTSKTTISTPLSINSCHSLSISSLFLPNRSNSTKNNTSFFRKNVFIRLYSFRLKSFPDSLSIKICSQSIFSRLSICL